MKKSLFNPLAFRSSLRWLPVRLIAGVIDNGR